MANKAFESGRVKKRLWHSTSIGDRLAMAMAAGCFGLVLGVLLSFAFPSIAVIWYTGAYFMVVAFILGPVVGDIMAMVLAALAAVALQADPYEKNPFDKPWHWLLLTLFILGFIAVVVYAVG